MFACMDKKIKKMSALLAWVSRKKVKQSRYRPGMAQRVPGS
jgi:hypothetical protein